jgi:hypothetical protein
MNNNSFLRKSTMNWKNAAFETGKKGAEKENALELARALKGLDNLDKGLKEAFKRASMIFIKYMEKR